MKFILYELGGYNTLIFLYINKITNIGILPYFLAFMSLAFNYYSFILYSLVFFIYFYLKIKNMQPERKLLNFSTYFTIKLELLLCYTLFMIIYYLLKHTLNMPRPYCSLELTSFLSIHKFSSERCLSSFPSAHTGLVFMAYLCLNQYLTSGKKLLFSFIIITIALSRISLAMHFPADVIYSFPIAFAIYKLNNYLFCRYFKARIETLMYKFYSLVFPG